MQHSGTLRTWDDARGFGFIAPTQGGRELFVHISAFPHDGSRPTVGEALLYETEFASDGRLQAVRVRRKALGDPSTYPRDSRPRGERRRSGLMPRMVLVLAIALGAFAYSRFQRDPPALAQPQSLPRSVPQSMPGSQLPPPPPPPQLESARAVEGAAITRSIPAPLSTPTPLRFACDGRTRCSQMTSCAEAKFFLVNCPGPEMDGDGDGIPCEQQWCTHSGAQ